jgi:Flp pilus assembly protein TadG
MHKTRLPLRSLVKRLVANEDGVVAIEFGVVASFLILMLIGATDLGFAARHRSQMEGAVRAGILEAMKGGTEEAMEAAVTASTDLPTNPAAAISVTKVCYDKDGGSCGLRRRECYDLYRDRPRAAAQLDPRDARFLEPLHPQSD